MLVILAPNLELAKIAAPLAQLTVEAEYGSVVIEGSRYTAAHHQAMPSPFAATHVGGSRPAPCNDPNIPVCRSALVSHLDLDTIGGVLRGQGHEELFDSPNEFWRVAEFVDVNGPHKLHLAKTTVHHAEMIDAWWAWSRANLPRPAMDRLSDVTDEISRARVALVRIVSRAPELIEAGMVFRAKEVELNRSTYRGTTGHLIVRETRDVRESANHLYATPSGDVAAGIVTRNLATGAVTVSISDPIVGVSCREFVQSLWGPEAGGHDGIAGGPRGLQISTEAFHDVVKAFDALLDKHVG